MTRKSLQSLYATLSAEERTALACSAAARGDEVELDRLYSSAPRERWIIPHHNRVFRAVSTCAVMHRAEQLELVATYWFAAVRANESESHAPDSECNAQMWMTLALSCAHRFCANVEAFRLFCEELGICVDDVMCDIPGKWLIELAEMSMPSLVPPPDELDATLKESDCDMQTEVVTVADLLGNLRSMYRALSGF